MTTTAARAQARLTLLALYRERARVAARAAFRAFPRYVNPAYRPMWFHDLIADRCQDLYEGRIRNLMVFMPPQHGKSELLSRCFPAWALGKDPDLKIVGCSYAADLAEQFSRAIQRIMDGDDYHDLFPATRIGDLRLPSGQTLKAVKGVGMFETIGRRGFYKAVGVGGPLTGTPVDIAIMDDPVKDALQAYSATYRERVWDWYNTVLTTRLHNDSRRLFIMTRWHEDDLAGRILKSEADQWHVLTLPAICEERGDHVDSPRQVGEELWPDRHSIAKLLRQKERSPHEFAALYQQHPSVDGGNIVRREWFGRMDYDTFTRYHNGEPIDFFLDTAYRSKFENNDPSGILAATSIRGKVYVLHAERQWLEMPDLLRWLPAYMERHGGDRRSRLFIEPRANGISVVQMLRAETRLNVRETPPPTESKEVRLRVASPRIECGRVTLVDGTWTEDFLQELCAFPAAPHDEMVDILGYAINELCDDPNDWEGWTKEKVGLF